LTNNRARLIRQIQEAFAEVTLKTGLTLRECAAADSCVEPSHPDLAEISECSCWQDIPEHDMHLIGTHGVLIHGGNDGAVFHLPAAMIHVLKYYDGDVLHTVADIANSTEFAIESGLPLTPTQEKAVRAYRTWLRDLEQA